MLFGSRVLIGRLTWVGSLSPDRLFLGHGSLSTPWHGNPSRNLLFSGLGTFSQIRWEVKMEARAGNRADRRSTTTLQIDFLDLHVGG